jgi:hypothetical protein
MLIVEDLRLMLGTIRIVVEEEDARKSVHRTKAGYDVVDAEDARREFNRFALVRIPSWSMRSCETSAWRR